MHAHIHQEASRHTQVPGSITGTEGVYPHPHSGARTHGPTGMCGSVLRSHATVPRQNVDPFPVTLANALACGKPCSELAWGLRGFYEEGVVTNLSL